MRITTISTIHEEKLPAYVADLLKKNYETIQIQRDSVKHYKIQAERELTEHEERSAGFELVLPRSEGRNEGNEKGN